MTTSELVSDDERAIRLRETMVEALAQRTMLPLPLAEALRVVKRHLFFPGSDLHSAYSVDTTDFTDTSNLSDLVDLLRRADIRPGMNVLLIGAVSYTAAVIAELVGAARRVTIVDVDATAMERTERLLNATGYGEIRVRRRSQISLHTPYDRVVVSVMPTSVPTGQEMAFLGPEGHIVCATSPAAA